MEEDYKERIKERIKILPEQLRTFVLDENWRRDVERVGKRFNFDEEKYASFENEVFLVLLCFEPKTDFIENIKTELGIDTNVAGWIADDVDKNIFSKVAEGIDSMWQAVDAESIKDSEQSEEKTPTQSNSVGPAPHSAGRVGTDFEQIILNQAKAMRPAQDSSQQPVASSQVPKNLPTERHEQMKVPNYSAGQDPYREPIE